MARKNECNQRNRADKKAEDEERGAEDRKARWS